MATISDILLKDQVVHSVSPDTTLEAALQIMAREQIGALIVLNEDGSIAGIFSERDFARKTLTIAGFHLGLPVSDLMTTPVYFLEPDHSLEDCMNMMTEKRFRHLPVVQAGKLLGIISIRDVVDWLIADKTFEIHKLEHFISSQPEEE
jgi:CBS domain-containing protein